MQRTKCWCDVRIVALSARSDARNVAPTVGIFFFPFSSSTITAGTSKASWSSGDFDVPTRAARSEWRRPRLRSSHWCAVYCTAIA